MARRWWTVAGAAALAVSGVATAQTGAAENPDEIVVKGKREREAQIKGFIDALAPERFSGQIARFSAEVCPGVLGPQPRQAAAVAQRLRLVGEAVGAPLAKPGCKPNLWVAVTEDRPGLVRQVRASWRDGLGNRPALGKEPGLATVLHLEGLLDANRQPVGTKVETGDGDSGYYQTEFFSSQRIRPSTTRTFVASVLVVEPKAIEGLTTVQLADYAAMRLLARADPDRLGPDAPPSILSILAAPMDSEVPETMTSWDLAFLKALYGSDDRSYAGSQKAEMQSIVRKELTGQDKAPKRRK